MTLAFSIAGLEVPAKFIGSVYRGLFPGRLVEALG